MPGCIEFNVLCDEEMDHETQFVDSWEDIPETIKERMTVEETEKYYLNPEAERAFDEENTRKKGVHLLQCADEKCAAIKKAWESNERLATELKKCRDAEDSGE